jgi:hypothetical protein
MKNVNKKVVIKVKKGKPVTLTASYVGDYEWSNRQKTRSIIVTPPVGTHEFSVHDKFNCIADRYTVIVSN